MKYVTWLLIPGGTNPDKDPAVRVASELGARRGDLGRRPRFALWTEDGHPKMLAATRKEAEDLRGRIEKSSDVGLSILSLLPAEDVRKLIGGRVHHAGQMFVLEGATLAGSNPYYRRFLRIRKQRLSEVDPDLNSLAIHEVLYAKRSGNATYGELYIDPVRIEFESDQLNVFADLDELIAGSQCAFLPPVRAHFEEESYYSPGRIEARRQLNQIIRNLQGTYREPLALKAWHILDDPLIRDLIAEGAVIQPHVVKDTSCLTLSVKLGLPDSPVSKYRRSLFEPSEGYLQIKDDLHVGGLNTRLQRCLKADLEDAGVIMQPGDSGVPPERQDIVSQHRNRKSRQGDSEGSFQDLLRLHARLSKECTCECDILIELLNQANTVDASLYAPDHALAEELFINYLWRCPWSNSVQMNSWRRIFLELLHVWRTGQGFDPFQYDYRRNRSGVWPCLEVKQDTTEFTYLPKAKREGDMLTRWLLLLPEGTIVREGGVFVLGDAEIRLDEGFVLA